MNLHGLRGAIGRIAGVAMLSLGLLGVGLSWRTARQAEDAADHAHDAARRAQAELQRLEHEAPSISTARRRLDAFEASPLLGPASRIAWAERTRAVAARSGVDRLRFEIDPARRVGSLDAARHHLVYAHAMRLDAELRHEGALLDFLSRLGADEPGRLHPARCLLERLREDTPGPLKLQCELDWLGIEPVAAEAGPR